MEVLTSSMSLLLLGGVGLLDHPGHVPVLAVHDPPVPGGVLDHGRQQGGAGVLGPVGPHQRGQRLGAQQRRVPGEDHHVLDLVVIVVGQPRQPDGQRVAGPGPGQLLHELDLHGRRRVLHQGLGDPLAPVAHDDDDPPHVDLGHGVEHVQNHRAPTQEVQGLGALGPHPGPLPGGQDDGGKTALGHRGILSPPECPACVWDTRGRAGTARPTTSSGCSTRTPPSTACPTTGRPRCGASTSRSRPAGRSPAWSGAAGPPSSCWCTAGRRTPTPGTPWRWPWAGRCWPSTSPGTATPTAGPTAPSRPAATAATWRP